MDVDKLTYNPENFEKLKETVKALQKTLSDFEIAEILRNPAGFVQMYYQNLNKFKNNIDAFNYLNEKYFLLTGSERYASFESFLGSMRRYLKKIRDEKRY